MKKKGFVIFCIGLLVIIALYFKGILPVVIVNGASQIVSADTTLTEFNPLEKADFNSGKISCYLAISKNDISSLPQSMTRYKIFKCTDQEILQALKESFQFKRTGGDMATCESSVFIYNGDRLLLHTSLILTDSIVGIQSRSIGWSEAVDRDKVKMLFSKFKPLPAIYTRF
jgi:hypothetical protein